MAFNYQKDSQNIVTITMDMDGRSANVINNEFSNLWIEVMERLENEKKLAGVIIASAKKTFLAGGDLEMIIALDDPEQAFNLVEKLKFHLMRIEKLGKPIVAVINGAALGGGLEIALCCNHRIALNNPKTKIGFPEVTLGILPTAGGLIRTTRLIGLEAALPFLLDGKQVTPSLAKKLGIIDDTADNIKELFSKAKQYILANPTKLQQWDTKDYKMPGGNANDPKIGQMHGLQPKAKATPIIKGKK